MPTRVTIDALIEQYQVLLFDAFGVLLETAGAFPDAIELINRLNSEKKPFFILTNGAKFPVTITAERYRKMGLAIADHQVISSGSLIADWIASHNFKGCQVAVMGPESSRQIVRDAGCEVAPITEDVAAFILCDQSDVQLPGELEIVLSALYQKFDAGKGPRLLLPNPDLIYPQGGANYGITSGSLALIIEKALGLRFRSAVKCHFERLGKPYRPIFEKALKKSGTMNMVLIGDQLDTDIVGANSFGIASALVTTGIGAYDAAIATQAETPRYIMSGLK